MSMQGVGYTTSPVNINSNYAKQNAKVEENKNNEKKEKIKKYAIGALGALAIVGTAVLVAHKIKNGKKVTPPSTPSAPVAPPSAPTSEVTEKVADKVAEHTPKTPITLINEPEKITSDATIKLVDASTGKKATESASAFARSGHLDVAEVAEEIGEQGKSISKPKKIITRNLEKPQKKELKEVMTTARNEGAAKTKKAQEALQQVEKTLNNAANNRSKILHQIETATSAESIDEIVGTVEKKVIDRAIIASDTLAGIESSNPQVLERIKTLQTRATQETEKADSFIDEVTTKAQKMKEKIAQEAKEKTVQQSNPQVIANQEKQATSKLKSLRRRPKNKKCSKSEFLQAIINNPKETEATRKLAQSKLDELVAKK